MSTRRAPFADPAWREGAERFLRERLAALGRPVVGAIEQRHLQPWATAFTVPTAEGLVWAKATSSAQRQEIALTAMLARLRPELVPVVIDADEHDGWLLLEDAGARLRDVPLDAEVLDRFTSLLVRYASLQRDAAALSDRMVAIGLGDLRPERLAHEYGRVLEEIDTRGVDDDALRAAEPSVRAAASRLMRLGPPSTVQHDDLHDGNVFVGAEARVLDWGDAVVGHPFGTLLVVEEALGRRLAKERPDLDASSAIGRVRDAYLGAFSELASLEELRAAADDACRLAMLARAWTLTRLFRELGDDPALAPFAGAAAGWLRRFLKGGDART